MHTGTVCQQGGGAHPAHAWNAWNSLQTPHRLTARLGHSCERPLIPVRRPMLDPGPAPVWDSPAACLPPTMPSCACCVQLAGCSSIFHQPLGRACWSCVQEHEQAQQGGPFGRRSTREATEGEAEPDVGVQARPRRTPAQQTHNNEVPAPNCASCNRAHMSLTWALRACGSGHPPCRFEQAKAKRLCASSQS